ncbi:MAG: B12-binding domain-containing radical SAM protein, partial [Longimicrobiales bacterium]
MRRKVVLYNPDAVFFTMPLALVAIGSHLDPERYEVVIVDGRLEKDPVGAVARHLEDALCFGVTVLTGAPIRDAVHVSRAVKAARPDLPVIWGGWHPSMFGPECLAEWSVDVTVQGQGEATFAEIVERLAADESIEDCAGCTYSTPDGKVRRNPARPLEDVNTFRPHDYRMISVERYYGLKRKKQLDFITSQGCHFRCAFCADPFVYKRKWVGLEAERVGEEIEALCRR